MGLGSGVWGLGLSLRLGLGLGLGLGLRFGPRFGLRFGLKKIRSRVRVSDSGLKFGSQVWGLISSPGLGHRVSLSIGLGLSFSLKFSVWHLVQVSGSGLKS